MTPISCSFLFVARCMRCSIDEAAHKLFPVVPAALYIAIYGFIGSHAVNVHAGGCLSMWRWKSQIAMSYAHGAYRRHARANACLRSLSLSSSSSPSSGWSACAKAIFINIIYRRYLRPISLPSSGLIHVSLQQRARGLLSGTAQKTCGQYNAQRVLFAAALSVCASNTARSEGLSHRHALELSRGIRPAGQSSISKVWIIGNNGMSFKLLNGWL